MFKMASGNMEAVLQYINKNFVTVADGDVKATNEILAEVLDAITESMSMVDELFNNMFETFVYGGSSYDGLKVSKPDEFDIDLKLILPEILDVQLEISDREGFVYLKLKDWKRLTSDTYLYSIYRDLEKLKDEDNYLCQTKIKSWMQGIVDKAINRIREKGTLDDILLKSKMSGPAVTLRVTNDNYHFDIDLVAVFRIPGIKWPAHPVRQNTNKNREDFLVVPKPPKDAPQQPERYWRLSFPEQEKDIIKGLNFCKPAIRLLKKLRDTNNHNIPSYFIKTIFLWEIENREDRGDSSFWNSSLTNVFMEMLIIYRNYLDQHYIPYFWNKNNNFLQLIASDNVSNIKNYLNRIIKKIKAKEDTDPYIIAEYLLPPHELEQVKNYYFNNTSVKDLETDSDEYSASGLMQQDQDTGISTGAVAIGIGAALLGWFVYNRNRRNQ